jgi:hypothetical protein
LNNPLDVTTITTSWEQLLLPYRCYGNNIKWTTSIQLFSKRITVFIVRENSNHQEVEVDFNHQEVEVDFKQERLEAEMTMMTMAIW